MQREHFTYEELLGLSQGNLIVDAPNESIRLPAPPMLMLSRVVELERRGSRGRIVGEQDINVADWFFHCHFRNDPVQPGCLGVDAIWQLVGLYTAANGAPGSGRALGCKEVEFTGQIRPYNKVVRYEVDIRRFSQLKDSGSAVSIGTAKVLVDGEHIYTVKDAKVGMFLGIDYPDYPAQSQNSVGGIMDRGD
ncbi:MAG TPA: bifunctional 3-hydroxydecanoyl-ACP dehydratase/trans-2-decenoyl-ACP isomerase [Candidatus Latescibacteria bacterium]|nr:bifunctional 3-hydroxydecanoyl-ACP dehydratase/trans-2-decenoyl-ACP isomerase [Gemmatimonadaceae bacterium]MDP6015330.1 bifunctional 3-hydroxydecanoyl-ACP dehydratase/trans-2-decenoyl-ACP isomerase [Candidatus Latescibacterota bacterium]HJP31999.1 bifunctional 3-hydroxydecanoyl-ACP dehydratase/trans-2-decenoyl-ACP isomerase [Candidatus Latescibacterota bacterium]